MRLTLQTLEKIEEVRGAALVTPTFTDTVETLIKIGYDEWKRQHKRMART